MINIVYLLAGQIALFLLYFLVQLSMDGWFSAPSKGGMTVLSGLVTLIILLGLVIIDHRKENAWLRRFISENNRIRSVIKLLLLLITVLLFIIWTCNAFFEIRFLYTLRPYQSVVFFLGILTAQTWLLLKINPAARPDGNDLSINRAIIYLFVVYGLVTVAKILVISPLVHSLIFRSEFSAILGDG